MVRAIDVQMDLLIQLADKDVRIIDSELLKDSEIVKKFFNSLARDILLQARFIWKLATKDILRLCKYDILPEEALIHIFFHTTFPLSKMLDILRQIDFDSRKMIMAELRARDYFSYDELEKKIDARYGMIEGVFFEDISEKDNSPTMLEKLKESMADTKSPLDYFKQYLLSAVKDIDEYKKYLDLLINNNVQVFKDKNKKIAKKEEFAHTVKFAYLLTIKKEITNNYQDQINIILVRLFRSLMSYTDVKVVIMLLEQFPELIITNILKSFLKYTESKDTKVRNKVLFFKKQIEAACQKKQAPKIKKAIRRGELGYNIDMRNGERR